MILAYNKATFLGFVLSKLKDPITNLRDAARRWWDSSEIKFAQVVVVFSHGSLSLKDLNGNGRLVVGRGGENLGLLRWDHGVTGELRQKIEI